MDRMVKVNIGGIDRYLNYSVEVMFDVQDKYGNLDSLFDILNKDGKETLETLTWLIVRMANDGEMCRRAQGYDHSEILKDSDLMGLSPYDYMFLKNAAAKAINYGYRREVPDDEQKEIDLGLRELQENEEKKTDTGE